MDSRRRRRPDKARGRRGGGRREDGLGGLEKKTPIPNEFPEALLPPLLLPPRQLADEGRIDHP
eukprot:7775621-Pyramimonas_sp.AAC.1